MWRVVYAFALCGCDLVFRIREPSDAGGPIDTPPLLVPPDGATACAPSPPPFETWTYTPTPLPSIRSGTNGDQLGFVALYNDDDGVHAILESQSQVGFWDGKLGDAAASAIDAFPLKEESYGVLPDGAALFYLDGATLKPHLAVHTGPGAWTPMLSDYGFPSAFQLFPHGAAYHDGTIRVIARVDETVDTQRIVELSTTDGLSWKALDTFKLALAATDVIDPTLSPDGCYLLFVLFNAIGSKVQLSPRDSAGDFTQFTEIAK